LKNKLLGALSLLAIPLLSCLALTSGLSTPNNPQLFTGGILIQGKSVLLVTLAPATDLESWLVTLVLVS
jgi:hypothetical protein